MLNNILSTLYSINQKEWEKDSILYKNKLEDDEIKNFFDESDLSKLLNQSFIPENCFRVVDEGDLLSHSEFVRPAYLGNKKLMNVLDGYKAAQALQSNKSIVFSVLEEIWPKTKMLCNNLSEKLNTRCSCFMVVSPPNVKGFVPHIDRTDQLVIQVVGSKNWKVYDVLNSDKDGYELDDKDLEKPIIHEKISKGDFLYIPQGAAHEAYSSDDLSIHITLTFEPHSLYNMIQESNNIVLKRKKYNHSLSPSKVKNGFEDGEKDKIIEEFLDDIKKELKSNIPNSSS